MKRIFSIILCLAVLSGCGSKQNAAPASTASDPQEQCAYTAAFYETEQSADVTMLSNGSTIAAMAELDDKNYAGTLFQLSMDSTAVRMEEIASFPDYTEPVLLGVDSDGSFWICGEQNDACFLLHTDSVGTILMDLNLNAQGDIYAVRSFACDANYLYLTVECARESTLGIRDAYDALFVYTKAGEFVTSKYFEELKSETLGFLDVEEDWMDDLEAEEELPGELFAGQIKDRYQFISLANQEVGMLIERRAPIGTETYHILCTVTPGTLEVTPKFGYEVEVSETLVMNFPISGAGTNYDLLVWESRGIFGVDMDAQEYVLLQSWSALSTDEEPISMNNLNQSAVGLSDGRLVFERYNGYTGKYSFAVLTPTANNTAADSF